jgi:hypothetical protein
MLVNTAIMSEIFQISLWNFFKLSIMSSIFFYWIPQYVFPQYIVKDKLDKIMFNILYMLTFILLSIPAMVQFHIFSFPLFLLLLFFFKGFFLYFFEKRNYTDELIDSFRKVLIKVLDIIDNFYINWKVHRKKAPRYHLSRIQTFLLPESLFTLLTYFIFIYCIYIISLGGFISYADAVPDTVQFVEWVHSFHENILFKDGKTPGADFYGQATFVFFLQIISGIDSIVLFNIYPALLVFFVLFGLYYVVYKITFSRYSAAFSVFLFGVIFLSPLAHTILGYLYQTELPNMVEWNGLSFYLVWLSDVLNYTPSPAIEIAHIPYERYSAGLAYELSSSMFLLNNYFITRIFTHRGKDNILLYAITLFLVFTFHGGGAIYLVVSNIFIFIAAVLFGKFHWQTFKQGLIAIFIVAILGNLWTLSVIKYGIPQDFGAAAPFLDTLFSTKESVKNITDGGEILEIILLNKIQVSIVFAMLLLPFLSIFRKRKFLYLSMSLTILAVMLIYFAPNLGLPRAVKQTRAAEYLLSVFAMGSGIYFYFFVVKPLSYFKHIYLKYSALFISVVVVVITITQVPRWIDTNRFMRQTNSIGYNDLAYIIYKISKENQPFSWSVVSYVQSYPKLLGKAYHINTTEFLLNYNPSDSELKIMSKKIYIFVENSANQFKGTGEWYYRWRPQVQEELKQWINFYLVTHDNISVYYQNNIVTVYEIDNSEYVIKENKRLTKLKKLQKKEFQWN